MAPTSTLRALPLRIPPSSKLLNRSPPGKPAAFTWRFGKIHAYSYSGGHYLENFVSPLHGISVKRWNAKKEPLWISVVAAKHCMENNSRCVRSWLTRRLKVSFSESLRKNGYAPDGTSLGDGHGDAVLYGTAQLFADRQMLNTSPEELDTQTSKVVDEIIRLQSVETPGRKKSPYNNAGR